MALRLRRGTDAERLLITPVQGELIYTTDTKKLYIGDGTAVGGRLVEGAGSPDLAGLDDINVAGAEDGQLLAYNSATLKWEASDLNGVVQGSNYQINIIGSDSSTIVNAETLTITADVVNGELFGDSNGTHTGAVVGNVTGALTGDVTGSVFGDDSTLIVDGIDGSISTDVIRSSRLEIKTDVSADRIELDVVTVDQTSSFRLLRKSDSDISADAIQYGRLVFGRSDIVGLVETCSISGYQDGFAISHDTSGLHTSPSENFFIKDGAFAFGTFAPATNAKVDVAGNLHVTGGYTQFGSLDTSQRNALTPANGMVIYNTTNNKFEGYQNSAWINLDDGLAAS
jgi:hypothetical protein